MAPSRRDLQLTPVTGESSSEIGDMEEVRLLDSYYNEENADDILSKIEEGGGGDDSGLRKIQVGITGMTCAACSNSVEGALMNVNGVFKASVALLQNRADVVFDPNLVKVFINFLLRFSTNFNWIFEILYTVVVFAIYC